MIVVSLSAAAIGRLYVTRKWR